MSLWIKFDHWTKDKPEVFHIAEILNIDPDAVLGKLLRIWVWADQNTDAGNAKGNAPSVTKTLLDRLTCVTGFANAMVSSGWLTEKEGAVMFTNFERHNGETAKSRAQNAIRQAKYKALRKAAENESLQGNAKGNGESVTISSAESDQSKSKSKSKSKETPLPPLDDSPAQTALPGAAPSSPESESKKRKRPQPEPIMIPDNLAQHPEFAEAWGRWEAYRREGRKTMNTSTRNAQLQLLSKNGPSVAMEMIATSITNGWTGLFPPEYIRNKRNGSTQPDCLDAANYVGAPCMSEAEIGGVAF